MWFSNGLFPPIGEIERAFVELADALGIETYDQQKLGDVHNQLLDKCPKLHTREELADLGTQFVNDLTDKFGRMGVRIFEEILIPTFGNASLEMKYNKLVDDVINFEGDWLTAHDVKYKVDAYCLGREIIKVLRSNSRRFDGDDPLTTQLWGVIKTIRDNFWDEDTIRRFLPEVRIMVDMSGNSYYQTKDLSDPDILKELYNELGEIVGDKNAYGGHELFHRYDGYGNVIFELY